MRVIFFTMFTSYLNAYTFYHFLGDTSKKRAFFSTLLPLRPHFYPFFPTCSRYMYPQEILHTIYAPVNDQNTSFSIVNMHIHRGSILNWHNRSFQYGVIQKFYVLKMVIIKKLTKITKHHSSELFTLHIYN